MTCGRRRGRPHHLRHAARARRLRVGAAARLRLVAAGLGAAGHRPTARGPPRHPLGRARPPRRKPADILLRPGCAPDIVLSDSGTAAPIAEPRLARATRLLVPGAQLPRSGAPARAGDPGDRHARPRVPRGQVRGGPRTRPGPVRGGRRPHRAAHRGPPGPGRPGPCPGPVRGHPAGDLHGASSGRRPPAHRQRGPGLAGARRRRAGARRRRARRGLRPDRTPAGGRTGPCPRAGAAPRSATCRSGPPTAS